MLALVFFFDPLILLVLVVEDGVFDFKSGHEAGIMPEKGTFGAHDGVYLTHRLHNLQLVVVKLGWHQIDIPHSEVGVEKDDSLHGKLG